jgi:hypothetical protein
VKVGDLLYYRSRKGSEIGDSTGIVVALEIEHDEIVMKTLWFDDWKYTREPIPGSIDYDEEIVGVLSEGR